MLLGIIVCLYAYTVALYDTEEGRDYEDAETPNLKLCSPEPGTPIMHMLDLPHLLYI